MKPTIYNPIMWSVLFLFVGLVAIGFIPCIPTTEVIMESVTVQVPHEYETTIPIETSKIKEMEEIIFDEEEILVGWGTFAYRVYYPHLSGKIDPEIYGRFEILEEWVKDQSGKRWYLEQGIPFAIFDSSNDFGIFQKFNSFEAVPGALFRSRCPDTISYASSGTFHFAPEPDTWYYFVFSNHTAWDREALLSLRLVWNERVIETEVSTVPRVEMVDVQTEVAKEKTILKSIFQLLFQ